VELPEKQGLKLFVFDGPIIEIFGCSGTSRKTRIETLVYTSYNSPASPVAVELPEKQGLKPPVRPSQLLPSRALQWNFQKNKD